MLYHLDLSPSEQVDLLLFRNVTNAPAVRKLVISGNLPAAALNPTLVRLRPATPSTPPRKAHPNPSQITHTFPVLAATQSAFQKRTSPPARPTILRRPSLTPRSPCKQPRHAQPPHRDHLQPVRVAQHRQRPDRLRRRRRLHSYSLRRVGQRRARRRARRRRRRRG